MSAATLASQAATEASQQAQAAAIQSRASLLRATQALQAMQAAQAQARAAASSASTNGVTDGLSSGGLIVDPRVTAGTDPNLWINANLPTQATSNGVTAVNIQQTSRRAVMTWQQFNVGRSTVVNFDQSGGNTANGNSWVALNRIDATGVPSQIQGQINAQGTVLLINPNGIIFNGSSQVNVHTLIASAADLSSVFGTYQPVTVNGATLTLPNGVTVLSPGSQNEDNANTAFVGGGLYTVPGGLSPEFSLSVAITGNANKGIVVQQGAAISTNVSGFDNGGYVALFGPNVTNNGSISTPAGQIILAAGSNLLLAQSNGGGTALTIVPPVSPPPVGSAVTNGTNAMLAATRGNITLTGDVVNQFGVAETTTSITRPGSITIAAGTLLAFGPSSATAILPEENGEKIPSNSLSSFVPPSITINADNMDVQGSVGGAPGALILAPGATMSVASNAPPAGTPTGRVLLESGSVIDLSGLNATASVTDYLHTFKVTANDVADSPLAANLIGQTVTIDLRQSGTRADGLTWVGSPLFSSSASGYLGDISQSIDQLLSKGGSLSFTGGGSASVNTLADVIAAPGSVINISGGTITYTGGVINTTVLLRSDGRLQNISNASPFMAYAGAAGQFTVEHGHWNNKQQNINVTEIWSSPFATGSYYQASYTDGISAGSLSVIASNPIFEGTLLGARQLGVRQALLALSDTGANGTQAEPDQLPLGASLSINAYGIASKGGGVAADAILLESGAPDVLGPNFNINSPLQLPTVNVVTNILPSGPVTTAAGELIYSTDILSAGGFGSIAFSSSSFIAMSKGAALSVLPGGSISLTGASTIDGSIVARAGKISVTGFNFGTFLLNAPPVSAVTIGPDALLDASGLWVNDSTANSNNVQGSAFINGGSISIRTALEGTLVADPGQSTPQQRGSLNQAQFLVPIIDTTQSIVLAPGSVIDVSSGGYVGVNGKLKASAGGLPAGSGGSVSLVTYDTWNGFWNNGVGGPFSDTFSLGQGGTFAPNQGNQPNQANIFLYGTIYSAGLSNGGSLTLQAPIIQVGGVSAVTSFGPDAGAQAGELALPASFFSRNGFSSYSLTSTYGGLTVTAGTAVQLQQQNYVLTSLPATGARVRDFAPLAVAPLGERQPVNLSLAQRAYPAYYSVTPNISTNAGILIDNGAAIVGDPGASIAVTANGSVTVLGRLTAPGGSIALTNNGTPEDVAFSVAYGGNPSSNNSSAAPQDIWIGSNAVLDVSGTFLPNIAVRSYSTGTVLPGGTISLDGPAIFSMPGSFFDLQGASASVQVPGVGISRSLSSMPLWSNGGTLSLNWSPQKAFQPGFYQTAYFDGTVNAAGGAPQASGGSLIIGSQAGTASYGDIIIPQGGSVTSLLNRAPLSNGSYPQTSAELNALGVTTSTTSNTISNAGTLTFTVAPGLGIPNGSSNEGGGIPLGQRVTITAAGNPQATISGEVLSYDPVMGTLTVIVNGSSGAGTYSRWNISTFTSSGYAYVAANTLNQSHFDSVTLVANNIAFSGNVNITLPGALTLAGPLTLLPAGSSYLSSSPGSIGGTVVNLNAGYALLAGRSLAAPTLSDGTLNVNATAQIDLAGGLSVSNAANVNLFSGGDIRLLSWSDAQFSQGSIAGYFNGFNLLPRAASIFYSAGELQIPDNLTLAAREVYPTADSAFLLLSGGLGSGPSPSNTITIASNGKAPSAPLSVDGQILIDAPNIVQGGALYAPLGTITLGLNTGQSIPSPWTNLSAITTQSLTIAPGSLTSVSAAGLALPYGTTINGATWLSPTNVASDPLTALPAKSIVLNGTSVNSMPGAVMDLSGGGDVYATEFVAGTGGSRNVLTGAGAGQTVYALLPGYRAPIAANDPNYGQAVGAGTSVTLAGGNGVAAGTYTLLPAIYATLPGAYRVVVVSTNISPLATGSVAPDGSIYTTGIIGNALTGSRSSQTALLEIQPNATWTRYSEIDIAHGNGFFTSLATKAGNVVPPLPADGGLLTVNATGVLNLQSSYNFAPAPGGRGGEAAIAGTNLLVLAPDQTAPAADTGYIVLNSDQLSRLGATTLLLGGTSALGASGLTITATANNLEVETDAAHPLSAPELLLVTQATGGAKGLTVDAGSTIAAIGNVPAGSDTPITIGAGTAGTTSGSLLRVSNGAQVAITRPGASAAGSFAIGTTPGTATIPTTAGSPVTIDGGVSLTLDTSGSGALAPNAVLQAQNYLLSGGVINLGNVPAGTAGLTISPQLIGEFDGANSVTLRSASVFNLYDTGGISFGTAANPIGTLTFDGAGFYSVGGTTTVNASNIDLSNSAGSTATGITGGGGTLTLNASGIITDDLGPKSLAGFSRINWNAGQAIAFTGSGGVDSGPVASAAPVFDVGSIAVTNGGQFYVSVPTVNITGNGGSGASATASLGVVSILVISGGSHYTNGAAVTVTGPSGANFSGTAVVDANGAITAVNISNPGAGFTGPITAISVAGAGSGANLTASLGVVSVTVNNTGSGYTGIPTLSFVGGGGLGATAQVLANITGIALASGGDGYTGIPTVTISGGGGSGATASATAIASGAVTGVTLGSGGTGYTSMPTVSFTGGGGGAAAFTLSAPELLVNSGASQSLSTLGSVTALRGAGTAPAISASNFGGALAITAASIQDGTVDQNGKLTPGLPIIALAGQVTLNATNGDIVLNSGAGIIATGSHISLFDQTEDAPGGSVLLAAAAGNVSIMSGASVDVSAAGNGYAGTLMIQTAPTGTATLNGVLSGGAAYNDVGGNFSLDAGSLSGALPFNSGFTGSFSARLAQGDIVVPAGTTLTSSQVLLAANNGNVMVNGTIDASSPSGGTIQLYGSGTPGASNTGVIIGSTAQLLACYVSCDPSKQTFNPNDPGSINPSDPGSANGEASLVQNGGTITLGTSGRFVPTGTASTDYNGTYGYENITPDNSGTITVAAGAQFNVSGGPGKANVSNNGGTVILRAPILSDGTVNVQFAGTLKAPANGSPSGSIALNAYAVWSTTDKTGGARHFDGYIDPAGWFSDNGSSMPGIDQNGYLTAAPTTAAPLAAGESFTPAPANADHTGFYQQNLVSFVQTPFNVASLVNDFKGAQGISLGSTLHLRPELDLVNPSSAINGGSISVLTNWNLGAGVANNSGNVTLAYRTTGSGDAGEPGVLGLLAANNVQINATLTDGFFQNYQNVTLPAIVPGSLTTPGQIINGPPPTAVDAYNAEINSAIYRSYLGSVSGGDFQFKLASGTTISYTSLISGTYGGNQLGPAILQAPAVFSSNKSVVDQYNQFYTDYVAFFNVYATEQISDQGKFSTNVKAAKAPPAAPTSATAASYLTSGTGYLVTYGTYLGTDMRANSATPSVPSALPTNVTSLLSILTLSAGADRCSACHPYDAPFAPYFALANGQPDANSLPPLQPGYVPTPPLHANNQPVGFVPPSLSTSATPAQIATAAALMENAIANNPGIDGVLDFDGNTTTSSNLMSVGFAGSQGSFSYNIVSGAQFGAADPKALVRAPVGATTIGPNAGYSVTLNGHTSYLSANSASTTSAVFQTIDVPTVLRTGTGSITITAAGSVELLDTTAPGAIYTAGAAAPLAAGFAGLSLPVATGSSTNGLVSNPSWGINGGAVTIKAGSDIVGIETPVDSNGSQTGLAGALTGEFWSAWYYRAGLASGEPLTPFDPNWMSSLSGGWHAQQNATWINYGTFFQGIGALGGGNVTLKAGADIDDISVSLPETIQVSGGMSSSGPAATAHFYGGGDLIVGAGGNLYSSTFYVGRGTGNIRVAGTVATDPFNPVTGQPTLYSDISNSSGTAVVLSANPQRLPLLLAVQDGFVTVTAGQSMSLGGVFDPTTIPQDMSRLDVLSTNTVLNDVSFLGGSWPVVLPATTGAVFNSYGAQSGIALTAVAGAVSLDTLTDLNRTNKIGNGGTTLFGFDAPQSYFPIVNNAGALTAPSTFNVQALGGDITLPIRLNLTPSPTGTLQWFAAGSITALYQPPTAKTLLSIIDLLDGVTGSTDNLPTLLGNPIPATLSAPLHGNDTSPAYFYAGNNITGEFLLDKPVTIWAGHNIINSFLVGENNNPGDITSVIAGNDITVAQTFIAGQVFNNQSAFIVYGPGSFVIEAGRNLGPFFTGTSPAIPSGVVPGFSNFTSGIYSVGDGSNVSTATTRPYLPVQGADTYVLFGVGPGIDYQAAMASYINPVAAGSGGINYLSYIASVLGGTPDEAWATFQGLSTAQQDLLINRAFLKFLSQVGLDYNNAASPYFHQYARAYDTIATLFPASRGYTDNRPTATNGAAAVVSTGDFNIAQSLLETQSGGNINIVGPGGNVIVGFNAADNSNARQEGILTLQGGSILTYTDQSVQVFQSRIFTEQGGDIDMFTANGDLNAGKGKKTSAAFPPLQLIWDVDGYSRVNPAGLVTGAGIGALLTIPGQDPNLSNVNLVAPRGTVDAGAAGIRVSGNLNIAALQVLNAFNIQTGGTVAGLPTVQGPPVAALTAANNVAGSAVKTDAPARSSPSDAASVIIVEFLGFGGGDDSNDGQPAKPNKSDGRQGSYDMRSRYQVVGTGDVTETEAKELANERRIETGR